MKLQIICSCRLNIPGTSNFFKLQYILFQAFNFRVFRSFCRKFNALCFNYCGRVAIQYLFGDKKKILLGYLIFEVIVSILARSLIRRMFS